MHLRKTKIVATIGPASASERELRGMVHAGMNVARLNFSHGTHEEHAEVIKKIREISEEMNVPVAILQDLSGPKIRIGMFETETIHLKNEAVFVLTTEKIVGDENRVYVNYEKLPSEVSEGGHIMLDDGKIRLRVEKVKGDEIHCKVIHGGVIRGARGVNVPGAHLSIGCLTHKDREDLEFGIKKRVDFVALSFVQTADDIRELRRILEKENSHARIIAKIETEEAVEKIDEILEVSDGLMVARGDLAVEVPAEDVPLFQKMIIKKSVEKGKPVITATQMLDSMISSSVPTRAEVNDVANAILDGTDAVMLSGETANGEHPVLTVETMARIAKRIEESDLFEETARKNKQIPNGVVDSVSSSVVTTARNTGAKAIVVLSEHGFTPRMISRYKPEQPVFIITPHEVTRNHSVLSFGTVPYIGPHISTLAEATSYAKKFLTDHAHAKEGDLFVLCAGVPFRQSGSTNMLLVLSV